MLRVPDIEAGADAAAAFNADYGIGTEVRYWPGAREGEGVLSTTRSPAWALVSGNAVIAVDGYAGGINLTHLEPVLKPWEIRRGIPWGCCHGPCDHPWPPTRDAQPWLFRDRDAHFAKDRA